MNTNDINTALKSVSCFKGTFPRDILPSVTIKPFAIVVNTDTSKNKGQHWVAFYFGVNNTAEYFDPYGLPPLYKEFNDYLFQNATNVFFNNFTLQSLSMNSNVCGNYCILFVKFKCDGYHFCQLLSLFSNNQSRNDIIIKALTK